MEIPRRPATVNEGRTKLMRTPKKKPPPGLVATSVKMPPEMKARLEQAAKDDARTFSSLVLKVLGDWLREQGK
jgi:hypothetical protein